MTKPEGMKGKRVLIGISGGIAAYKVCEVVSTLAKQGVDVRAILTHAAEAFITPLTLSTLCRRAAYTDDAFWQATHDRPLHIELGEWAELLVLAPLTANTLAKLVYGMADNLLLNTVLASTCPVLLAPAMNTDMWEQPPVQQNWQAVQTQPRMHTLAPSAGILACDRVGTGRMAEPDAILAHVESLLYTKGQRDVVGKHILISAGGTREFLDPVRFLGNPSTGKMGVALAQAALHRGATVTLVHTPDVAIATVPGARSLVVSSAAEMQQALFASFPQADWTIMAAAVADVKPASYSVEKLPKRSLPASLSLEPVPDIVAALANCKQPHQKLIGFAAQSGDIVTPALEKLQRKKLDAIAANPIDQADSGFGSDTNRAVLLDGQGRKQVVEPCSKLHMAHQLLDFIHAL